MHLQTEYIHFSSREARSRYVAKRFQTYLSDSLLDVGCFEAPLRDILKGVEYTGSDVAGKPEVRLNLDDSTKLPFATGEFHCVLCIDVLEHLDNLHSIFEEIVRVAKRSIIISLPNCWRDARRPIERGKGTFAHYGLPIDPPIDRHKWFFNYTQAREFLERQALKNLWRLWKCSRQKSQSHGWQERSEKFFTKENVIETDIPKRCGFYMRNRSRYDEGLTLFPALKWWPTEVKVSILLKIVSHLQR